MALKPGQIKCIQTLDAPLVVSAGAGSGKTFTLTQRIVNALATGAIDDIGQVLAITFTTKAAAELKSRVRGALRAKGQIEQALKVDSAWISTIHGACARMLRSHALELGIDPAFSIIDEARARSLLDEATENVMARSSDFVSPEGLDALFSEFSARSHGPRAGSSVDAMVRSLVFVAAASPEGIDSVRVPQAANPGALARRMVELAEQLVGAASLQKEGKRRDALLEGSASAIEACNKACASAILTHKGLMELLNGFPVPGRSFGTPDFKDFACDIAEQYKECMAEARFGCAVGLLCDAKVLAGKVLDEYRRLKRLEGGLDNDDLLVETAHAFANCPAMEADYADRFRLVMVDEFQDTDQLQVDMIYRLSGQGAHRLCTVGDAQQSIYRFRGADVSVYRNHAKTVQENNPEGLILLPDNFRSHADVLSFVDSIFSQPCSFGASFMSLSASRDEKSVAHPFRGAGPRIDVSLVTAPARGVSSLEVREQAAESIALRLSALRDAGVSAADMVLLLGSTTHADVYAASLRRAGFSCVVVKGSVFNRAPEVQLMVSLARAIANPLDSLALFEVLSSEMFALSADDFLALSTRFDEEGKPHRRSLWEGLVTLAEEDEPHERLSSVVAVLTKMLEEAGRVPLSAIMEQVIVDCGWLTRLEREGAEGQARAANVLKAVRMVKDVEAAGAVGLTSVASRFALKVSVAKEAPGALSATGGDFVRIMTVHASKGLEFPVVAVAELDNGAARADKLIVERVHGCAFASLDLGASVAGAKSSSLIAKAADASFGLDDCDEDELAQAVVASKSAGARRAALRKLTAEADRQEAKRLLYVALTRAKEALVVSLTGKRTKDDPSGAGAGIAADIQSALCGAGGVFPEGRATFDFGGQRPAAFERIDLEPADEANEPRDNEPCDAGDNEPCDAGEAGSASGSAAANASENALGSEAENAAESASRAVYDIFSVDGYSPRPDNIFRFERSGVFSYSSLAPHAKDHDAPLPFDGQNNQNDQDDQDDEWAPIEKNSSSGAEATDLGTAFHRLAQYAVETRQAGEPLACPPTSRIDALCRSCGLNAEQRGRLEGALGRWFSSSAAKRVSTFDCVRAEVPFFLRIDDADMPLYLEGEIDLIVSSSVSPSSAEGTSALVIDYKTGGYADEALAFLQQKHKLQAQCYALALLRHGYANVELVFVRVEQDDPNAAGEPQCVRYAFEKQDIPFLESVVRDTYHASV